MQANAKAAIILRMTGPAMAIKELKLFRHCEMHRNPASVIPGWCVSTRPQMCNCTSGILEIPGSMRSLSSGRALRGPVGIAPESFTLKPSRAHLDLLVGEEDLP